MQQIYCLNCSEEISKKFCANCGQKTDTHRITFKHFIFHDLVHGVWHIDKGIPFTLKQAIVRPGKAALEYISGKRKPFYNIFYLSLVLIALTLLFNTFIDGIIPDKIEPGETIEQFNDRMKAGTEMKNYAKLLIFGVVPLFALNARLVFRRLRLNFTEHCIIGGMCILGILTINLFYLVFYLLEGIYGYSVFKVIETISVILILFFPTYVYFGAAKNLYTRLGFIWRNSLFHVLFAIQSVFVTRLIYFLITGKISLFGHTF